MASAEGSKPNSTPLAAATHSPPHASALQPSSAAPQGHEDAGNKPFTIYTTRRQKGTILGYDAGNKLVKIQWCMSRTLVALYGQRARPASWCDPSEIQVTDGLSGGSWPYEPNTSFAATNQQVHFTLSENVTLPPVDQPFKLPSTLRAMAVEGTDEKPILVRVVGRLVHWRPYDPAMRRGGHGFIHAFGRDHSKLRVFVRSSSLMGPNMLPYQIDVRPQQDQAVQFTARSRNRHRNPEAERVCAQDGGPVKVLCVVDEEEELVLEDMEA
jgi:hypothetical protein